MSRRKVVRQARRLEQQLKRSELLPKGSRYVIVFTDETGTNIGVSSNTSAMDIHNLLVCALNGLNRRPHPEDVIDMKEEQVCQQ